MKAIRTSVVVFVLSLISFASFAAGSVKIGAIDLPKIMHESTQVRKIQATLSKKYASRRDNIVKKQKALQAKIKSFQRDSAVMKAAQKESSQRKIASEQRDLQRLQQDFQQDFSVEQNKAMQGFFVELRKIIEKYSKDNGYDLIVQKEAAPFVSSRVDVTNSLLKKLNAAG